MAIQPVDLSTVFTQMDKVSKFNASVEQNVKLVNDANINRTVQQNLEKTQQVHQTENDDSQANKVKPDGKNQNQNQQRKFNQKKKEEEAAVPPKKTYEIKDPLLGQHIDITR